MYEYEISSLIQRKEYAVRAFESKMLKKIFEWRISDVTE
jgi:hypothetical protein